MNPLTILSKFYLYLGVLSICFGVFFLYVVFGLSTVHYSQNMMWILISIGLLVLGILGFWGFGHEITKQKD